MIVPIINNNKDSKMADLYITYSIRERYWVSKLAASLESEGYSVWWDHAVIPGANVRNESQQALKQAKCVLVVWSETAIEDHWVLVDSVQAINKQTPLISVLAQGASIPEAYQSLEISDLKSWELGDERDSHFINLLETIKAYCPPSQPSQGEREKQAIARLERMRAESERKAQERQLREDQMIQRRMSSV